MTCRPNRPTTRDHQSPGEAAYVNSIYPIDIGRWCSGRVPLVFRALVSTEIGLGFVAKFK
jgi:hypothetical protein